MKIDASEPAGRAFLLLERGEPYPARTRIELGRGPIALGRSSPDSEPDLAFDNAFVSRRHLLIERRAGGYVAVDLGSKNGSSLNDAPMEDGRPVPLRAGDRLSLAEGAVVIFYLVEEGSGTLDLGVEAESGNEPGGNDMKLDDARREIVVRGEIVRLSGNLYALFGLLYRNRGRAVSNAEIREAVWPDRARDESGMPNAADIEINTLVMRLRKRLGDSGALVRNLRGYGYMLDSD